MDWLRTKNDKIIYRQSEKLEGELTGLDFRPAINRDSAYYATLSKSFEKRQHQYNAERSKKKQELEQKVYGKYSFRPLLSEKSDLLARKRRAKDEILEKAKALRQKHGFEDGQDSEEVAPEELVFQASRTRTASKSHSREETELFETTVSEFERTNTSARNAPGNARQPGAGQRGQKGLRDLQGHSTLGTDLPLKSTLNSLDSVPKPRKLIRRLPDNGSMPSSKSPGPRLPKEIVPKHLSVREASKKSAKPQSSRRVQESEKKASPSPRENSKRRAASKKKTASSRHV